MRILNLSPYLPWPLYGGNVVRIYQILRELSRRGHEIVLVAGHDGAGVGPEHPVGALCQQVVAYPPAARSREVRTVVAALRSLVSRDPYVAAKFGARHIRPLVARLCEQQRFDVIWANFAFMVDAVPPEVARCIPVVLDEHESEGLLWRQYLRDGNAAQQVFALLNLLKMPPFRRRIFPRVAAVACVSDREAAYTRRFVPQHVELWTVPNGVDTDYYRPEWGGREEGNRIVLCSGLSVFRNRHAAIWFATRVFPLVLCEVPDAEFWIVGSHPNREIWELQRLPGVHVTGAVEDVRRYYRQAAVAVAPYRYGEGTKLKVLEAMACGVPLVSTPMGCRGIEVAAGTHVTIAEGEGEFASAVTGLLRDRMKARAQALKARKLVEERYSWSGIVDDLEVRLFKLAALQVAPRAQEENRYAQGGEA
jgi:glycosyltransferase involved in cell wall biosynthesis